MKARKLTAMLNTRYIVHDGGDTINIGSFLCSELVAMNKETKRLTYALGWPHKNNKPKPSADNDDPRAIWEGLERLIASGEIEDILAGDDEIENPIPVFWEKGGAIFESVTDKIGWPHTTREGRLMHNSGFFAAREEAARCAVHGVWWRLNGSRRRESVLLQELDETRERIKKEEGIREILEQKLPGEFDAFDAIQAARDV